VGVSQLPARNGNKKIAGIIGVGGEQKDFFSLPNILLRRALIMLFRIQFLELEMLLSTIIVDKERARHESAQANEICIKQQTACGWHWRRKKSGRDEGKTIENRFI
jgi:hypothetical protein